MLRLSATVRRHVSPRARARRRRPRRVDLVGLEADGILRILATGVLLQGCRRRQAVMRSDRRSIGPEQGRRRARIFVRNHRASVPGRIVNRRGRGRVRRRGRLGLAARRRRVRLWRSVNERGRVRPRRGRRHVEVVPRGRGLLVRAPVLLRRGLEPTTVVLRGWADGSKRRRPLLSGSLERQIRLDQ